MLTTNYEISQEKHSNFNPYKELFSRCLNNPILTYTDWPYPTHSVFNPAATIFEGKVLLLVRVEDRKGFSHLTKAISSDGIGNWEIDPVPTFQSNPEKYPEEIWGVEDPRITRMEDLQKWAITYTSYSTKGPLVSIALTDDFKTFERLGPIMPPEDKDATIFPRKFNDKWLLIHRPSFVDGTLGTHIWASQSDDLKSWNNEQLLISSRKGGWWDANKVGICTQPLETTLGWLISYHGVKYTASGCIYRMGLALLDLQNPLKVLRRSDEWIFGPQEPYEMTGDVSHVVFPCGWILDPDTEIIKMYYGCADTSVGLATAKLSDVLNYIESCPAEKNNMLDIHLHT